MEAVDACEVPPIKVLRKDVPRRIIKVLKKAMRRNPKRRFKDCKEMERALHKLLKGSSVEQTDFLAEYMRSLFSTELKARDRAIRDTDGHERDLFMSTGFEMLDERATRIEPVPPAPTANRRYAEILAERQGQQTQVGAKGLDEADPQDPADLSGDEEPDEVITDPDGTQPRAPTPRARARKPGRPDRQEAGRPDRGG